MPSLGRRSRAGARTARKLLDPHIRPDRAALGFTDVRPVAIAFGRELVRRLLHQPGESVLAVACPLTAAGVLGRPRPIMAGLFSARAGVRRKIRCFRRYPPSLPPKKTPDTGLALDTGKRAPQLA